MNLFDKLALKNSDYILVGGPTLDTDVKLCIYADELEPNWVSERVGCSPSEAFRKGERNLAYPKRPPAPTGRWILEAPNDLSFENQIAYLLDQTNQSSKVWESLEKTHALHLRSVISLHSWTEGFTLSPTLLAEIAQRKWEFMVSIYSAEGEEIVASFLGQPPANSQS